MSFGARATIYPMGYREATCVPDVGRRERRAVDAGIPVFGLAVPQPVVEHLNQRYGTAFWGRTEAAWLNASFTRGCGCAVWRQRALRALRVVGFSTRSACRSHSVCIEPGDGEGDRCE
jgi:hypothetical protein